MQMAGKGTFTFPNGNKYEGEWANDAKNGYGSLYYVNGEKYEGYWKEDKGSARNLFSLASLREGDAHLHNR